jgi:tRNA(Leu) C34 or U34 (ribose-2'-O)-methylase TrmL
MDANKFFPFNVKDHLKSLSVKDIKSWQSGNSYPFSVAVYNDINDFNLAGVVRNACAFGLSKMFIIGTKKWDKRGAVGAYNYIDIIHYSTFDEFVQTESILLAPLELPEHYPDLSPTFFTSIHQIQPAIDTCLLIGLEGSGLPQDHLIHAPMVYYIPQAGCMRSLNAAVASGIAINCLINNYEESRSISYGA